MGNTPASLVGGPAVISLSQAAILFEDFGGFLSPVSKGMSQQIRVVRLLSTSFPFPY